MTINVQPLVSVVTPVYNGESFLHDCIESVLGQTYKNYEYIIVNNCSTDRTLDMALSYARKDSRIRVHSNKKFVGVSENHNIAFGLISEKAKYCKVISADDFLLPDCLRQMVQFAEENPSVGIVGSYQLSGSCVKWQGFQYPRAVFSGRELCRHFFFLRQVFVGGHPIFGFGAPTSMLYRADLIRDSGGQFYPNSSPHADTSACFKYLHECAFGFIYQILSYERTHDNTQTSESVRMNRYLSATLSDVLQYGPLYLTKEELEAKLKECVTAYHQFLAVSYFTGVRGEEFWKYHKGRLEELGYPLKRRMLLWAAVIKMLQEIVNPAQAFIKLWRRMFSESKNDDIKAAQPVLTGDKAFGPSMSHP